VNVCHSHIHFLYISTSDSTSLLQEEYFLVAGRIASRNKDYFFGPFFFSSRGLVVDVEKIYEYRVIVAAEKRFCDLHEYVRVCRRALRRRSMSIAPKWLP